MVFFIEYFNKCVLKKPDRYCNIQLCMWSNSLGEPRGMIVTKILLKSDLAFFFQKAVFAFCGPPLRASSRGHDGVVGALCLIRALTSDPFSLPFFLLMGLKIAKMGWTRTGASETPGWSSCQCATFLSIAVRVEPSSIWETSIAVVIRLWRPCRVRRSLFGDGPNRDSLSRTWVWVRVVGGGGYVRITVRQFFRGDGQDSVEFVSLNLVWILSIILTKQTDI